LVNEAWLGIYNLDIPQYASTGIRWAMMNYIQKQWMQKHRRNRKSKIESLVDEEIVGIIFGSPEFEIQDEVANLLNKLTLAEKLLIDQRYFQSLMIEDIAKIHNLTRQAIILKLQKILKKLKRAALRVA